MPATRKIVDSGIALKRPESLDDTLHRLTEELCFALIHAVDESLLKIREAQDAAIKRIEEYVPSEPLLNCQQAAAYLRLKPRQIDALTSLANPQLPFNKIGGQKRFRKEQLDAHLARTEFKRREVKL